MAGKAQNVAGLVSMLAATTVTKKLLDRVWRLGSGGKTPPHDPPDPHVQPREPGVSSVPSGIAVCLGRLGVARRLAAQARHAHELTGRPGQKDQDALTLPP